MIIQSKTQQPPVPKKKKERRVLKLPAVTRHEGSAGHSCNAYQMQNSACIFAENEAAFVSVHSEAGNPSFS